MSPESTARTRKRAETTAPARLIRALIAGSPYRAHRRRDDRPREEVPDGWLGPPTSVDHRSRSTMLAQDHKLSAHQEAGLEQALAWCEWVAEGEPVWGDGVLA